MNIPLYAGAIVIGVLLTALGYPVIAYGRVQFNNIVILVCLNILWALLMHTGGTDEKD